VRNLNPEGIGVSQRCGYLTSCKSTKVNLLFPNIESEEEYESRFNDPELGLAAASAVAIRHAIAASPERKIEGSNLLFRLGDRFWLKFYPPLFSEEFDAELTSLEMVHARLPVQVPEPVATGELEGWNYMIVTHLEGTNFYDLRQELSPEERSVIAAALGESLRALHALPSDRLARPRPDWRTFLQERIGTARTIHAAKGVAEPWLTRIEEYLDRHAGAMLALPGDRLLHADLHYEHVFLRREDDSWRLGGIIDFADAMAGAAEYEFIVPALWLFRGDRNALRSMFEAYGYAPSEIDRELSGRMLAWSLVHRFMRFNQCFRKELEDGGLDSLEMLAERVMPLP
jgi:hygromycin-B 7''-O-kinase